jgi:hypothetical protein
MVVPDFQRFKLRWRTEALHYLCLCFHIWSAALTFPAQFQICELFLGSQIGFQSFLLAFNILETKDIQPAAEIISVPLLELTLLLSGLYCFSLSCFVKSASSSRQSRTVKHGIMAKWTVGRDERIDVK